MSSPAVKPACSIASTIRSSASRLLRQVRREAALVAEAGGQAARLQHALEGVVDLGAPAQRLGEGRRADRGDHELLDVDVGVGVRAAVEDVHHRHRQHVGVRAADVAEQRQVGATPRRRARRRARRRGSRWRRACDLFGRAVQVDQRLVDQALLGGLEADQLGPDLVEHGERRPSRRPCRRSASGRRRAARPPRTRRCDAPEGTAARATVPSSSATSTSTVGLPRESRISRAPTASMVATVVLLRSRSGRCQATGVPRRGGCPARPVDGELAVSRRWPAPEAGAGGQRAGLSHRPSLLAITSRSAGSTGRRRRAGRW